MTSSIKTLLTYQISDLATFYMVGRLLVELVTTEGEVRKREIEKAKRELALNMNIQTIVENLAYVLILD